MTTTTYAVVGHPSRDYSWISSREPKLEESKLRAVLSHAQVNGLPTALLDHTEQ